GVLGSLASGWANDNLASITCETAPDILLCNDQGEVISMLLDGLSNNAQATIPADIANITSLTYLSMAYNSLTGTIPDSFSNLVLLQSLDVSYNSLKQPIDVVMTLTSLTYLNMSYNTIRAPLSPGISNLRDLEVLDLTSNRLDKIQDLSALTKLKQIVLERCAVPPAPLTTFSPLVSLEYINVFNNSFEGALSALSTLSKLEYMQVAFNQIGPDIPATLSHLSKVTFMDLAYNRLSGPINPLTNVTSLQFLSLYSNAVSGSFPDSITRLSRLTFLQIGETNFTGTLPASLGQMTNLRHFLLDHTTMVGTIPAAMGNLTRLAEISVAPLSATVGPKCAKNGVCVVNQDAVTAFCNFCPSFCQSCSPPGLCINCKDPSPPPAPATTSSSGLSTGAIIGIVCGVVVLLLALLGGALFYLQRRNNKVSRFGALAKGVCVEYTMKEMAQATNNWSDANLLGSGGFGDVFKGVSPDDGVTLWAVKRAKVITNDFQREVSEMATKHHPNLVRLLGYATCGDLRERIEQILVYEFIPNGDLDKWLGKDAPAPLTLKQRLDVIVGAARGFEYLHGFDIVHRDIKPANILLDSNMQPKVADFGLVRVEGGTTVQATRVMGTPGYVDPAYSRTQKATPATDVYSFGILMLVVLTGKHANFDDNGRSCFLLEWVREKLSKGSAETITDPRMGPAPPGALQRITDLAMHCTATFTADRPSMARIAQEMEALRSEVSGGEEPVHKSHKVVDAELKERMQEQKRISETMVSVLTSMNTGSMGSGSVSSFWGIREAGRTGDVSSKDAPPPEV
ncbi:unnamed protein product, partial [Closterium sp. Naga37s-1]